LLDQVAGALSLSHRNHVIHRDIKTGNIFLDEDGNAYQTDFGIAKDLNLPGNGTQPDAIIGSLDYISPEQARSEPITSRTNIYSLGVTLYEMIVGQHPFHNFSPIEQLFKHINDPLTTIQSAVAAQVNRVIQKATAKNPEYRYPYALALYTCRGERSIKRSLLRVAWTILRSAGVSASARTRRGLGSLSPRWWRYRRLRARSTHHTPGVTSV
jgi:eukaryotic-like serine/threonine-protein kinase